MAKENRKQRKCEYKNKQIRKTNVESVLKTNKRTSEGKQKQVKN